MTLYTCPVDDKGRMTIRFVEGRIDEPTTNFVPELRAMVAAASEVTVDLGQVTYMTPGWCRVIRDLEAIASQCEQPFALINIPDDVRETLLIVGWREAT